MFNQKLQINTDAVVVYRKREFDNSYGNENAENNLIGWTRKINRAARATHIFYSFLCHAKQLCLSPLMNCLCSKTEMLR